MIKFEEPPGDESGSWEGTPEELERWIEYKRTKALAFVRRGYSLSWTPDESNWMSVYVPQRYEKRQPEIRATVKFFMEPSQHGLDEGRISKLLIQSQYLDETGQVLGMATRNDILYNFDRGADVNELSSNARAQELFQAVVEELN